MALTAVAVNGWPVSRLSSCGRRPSMRSSRSSPSTWATFTVEAEARSRGRGPAVRSPAGFRPPALVTTLMPRSMHVPSTCSICVRNVPAKPASALRARCFCRISIVSSASQSPVSTSTGLSSSTSGSIISRAAEMRSPKKPEQLAMRIGLVPRGPPLTSRSSRGSGRNPVAGRVGPAPRRRCRPPGRPPCAPSSSPPSSTAPARRRPRHRRRRASATPLRASAPRASRRGRPRRATGSAPARPVAARRSPRTPW